MKTYLSLATAAMAALLVSSASAHELLFETPLGPEAVGATGIGNASVTMDMDLHTMRVQATFSGLSGNTSASHIHAPTALPFTGNAGVATQTPTFSAFPLGVQAGVFDQTFDMTLASSYNAPFLTAASGNTATAFNNLVVAMQDGKSYLNIHTSTFGGGEIRGYFRLVPEPTSLAGVAGMSLLVRRRR
jgi:hypothetical protein